MRFEGKIALITAAANGIGRASAGIMAREGATVVCVDNHQERLDGAVDAMAKDGMAKDGMMKKDEMKKEAMGKGDMMKK